MNRKYRKAQYNRLRRKRAESAIARQKHTRWAKMWLCVRGFSLRFRYIHIESMSTHHTSTSSTANAHQFDRLPRTFVHCWSFFVKNAQTKCFRAKQLTVTLITTFDITQFSLTVKPFAFQIVISRQLIYVLCGFLPAIECFEPFAYQHPVHDGIKWILHKSLDLMAFDSVPIVFCCAPLNNHVIHSVIWNW